MSDGTAGTQVHNKVKFTNVASKLEIVVIRQVISYNVYTVLVLQK